MQGCCRILRGPVKRSNFGSGPIAPRQPTMKYLETSVVAAQTPAVSSDKNLQRAEGCCRIILGGSEKSTRIMDLYQKSPIRVLFPRTAGASVEEAVIVNTSGGIAGGGGLGTNVTSIEEAAISMTT